MSVLEKCGTENETVNKSCIITCLYSAQNVADSTLSLNVAVPFFNTLIFLCPPLCCRVTRLQEELVSLRLQCSSVYRKGHFLSGGMMGEQTQRMSSGSLATLGAQTLLGAAGVMANLLRPPMSRSELVAMSSSEDEGSLRFIYELLGWVEATQVR